MGSRQDQVIDDDEPETCPLCIEELDLSDRGFQPCPCGYQICQFCYNNIKTTMNGLCPACRRSYSDKNIKFEAPSAEEVARYKESKSLQDRRRAAAKRQEAASRQADNLSRKHLAGIRVRRQNLVYVTGLRLNTSDPQLSEKLRGDHFFGQYGKIDKIVVNKPKDSRALQPVGVYITYFEKSAAALCISMVNGTQNAGGTIRADYGTTKYCSNFLRHEICTNKNCTFLHEVGEDNESFTREGLSSLNASSTQSSSSSVQPPPPSNPAHQHHTHTTTASNALPYPLPSDRSDSRSDTSIAVEFSDSSALPLTASWAHRNAASRRPSHTHSFASASPMASVAVPATHYEAADSDLPASEPEVEASKDLISHSDDATSPLQPDAMDVNTAATQIDQDVNAIKRLLAQSDLSSTADTSDLSEGDRELLKHLPLLFDLEAGARRYLARKRENAQHELEKDQQIASQALSAMKPDEHTGGGSLQLGGEPETRNPINTDRGLPQLPVQPPSGDLSSPTLDLAHALNPHPHDQLSTDRSSLASSSHQNYVPQSFKSPSPGLLGSHNTLPSNQTGQPGYYGGMGHARQSSRFSFATDIAPAAAKNAINSKFTNQQGGSMAQLPNQSSYNTNPSGLPFFTSGVQGPPPGLKATGTPPVSGGGMFGQGHGFATAGLGYGVNPTARNANEEMMRELLRNRGGSAGSTQASEGGRREFAFPSSQNQSHQSSPPQTPGSNFHYGTHSGAFQDHGQHGGNNNNNNNKQKKKGKKQRHANTSSSGGTGATGGGGGSGADLVDPSILQSRMHPSSNTGQSNHYSNQSQGQGGFNSGVYSSGSGGFNRW